jgi:NitT/TauT family transport system substrate-binding protein
MAKALKSIFILFCFVGVSVAGMAKAKVRVGYSPVASTAGIFIAQDRGYFRQEGLDVELIPFRSSGAPMTALLANDQLDVGAGNITAGLWNSSDEAKAIRIVADKGSLEKDHSYIALLVRSDLVKSGRYKSFKDLKGFRMALTALTGVSQQIATERFLKAGGLKLSDVRFVKMSYADMNIALKTKDIDATVQLEPYVTRAVMDGCAINVGGVYDVYPGQVSAAIFYANAFAEKRHDDAVHFMTAYLKGVRDYRKAFDQGIDRREITAILKKYTLVKDDNLWAKMISVGLNPNGYVNEAALKSDVQWYVKKGYVKSHPDLGHLVDNRFVREALVPLDKDVQK